MQISIPQSTLKMVADKENEIAQLEKQLAEFKDSGSKSGFANIKLDDKPIQEIRQDTWLSWIMKYQKY